MDTNRPPPPPLFFCFTSSSSSSMKMSSRSTLSPGRPGYSREPPPPISLPTSLSRSHSRSRRLNHSCSIRGAASPAMFPVVTGKKRGSGFDNPEPSSPKVTCIGQVRVKTKMKHAKNLRRRKLEHSRSQSQHLKSLHHQQQGSRNNNSNNPRWVHIPLTICEALRTLGSEVSCLFPCRSSTTPAENEEKTGVGSARWLVDAGGGRGDIELVGGDVEEMDIRNVRRHVFNNLEIVNDVILGRKDDEARVSSICVPPKNALLLMRGRSDPVKMVALTSRFSEPDMDIINIEKEKEEDEFEESVVCEDKLVEGEKILQQGVELEDEKPLVLDEINDQEETNSELEIKEEDEIMEMPEKQSIREQSIEINEEEEYQEQSMEINEEEEEESFFIGFLFEENADEDQEIEEEDFDMEDAREELFEDEDVEETETGESSMEEITHFEQENDEMLAKFKEISETGESSMEEIKQFEQGNDEMLTEFKEISETGESSMEEIKQFEQENDEMLTQFKEISETGESIIEEIKHFEEGNGESLTDFKGTSKTEESSLEEIKHFEQGNEEMFPEFEEISETEESNIEKIKYVEEGSEEMLTEFEQTGDLSMEEIKHFEEGNEEMLTEFTEIESLERENGENEERKESMEALPECLLLMMSEPKLSMEVSKETWVCSYDFIGHHSGRKKKPPPPPPPPLESMDSKVQPGRTSCSIQAPDSIIAMLEQKLVNTIGIEPLVLARCKSEPMKRAPETCCWQNQLEPPRRASFGVGMAGLAG